MELEGSASALPLSASASTPASSTPSESCRQENNSNINTTTNNNNDNSSPPSRTKTTQSRPQSRSSSPPSSSSSSPSSSSVAAAKAAVKFSTMQASFAEKTATEMEEIVRWFSEHPEQERFVVVNQSESLPNNAMVYEGTTETGTTTPNISSDDDDNNNSDDGNSCDDTTGSGKGGNSNNDEMVGIMKTPKSVKAKTKKIDAMSVATPFSPDVIEQIQTSDELIRATQYMADVIGELKTPLSPSSRDCAYDRSTAPSSAAAGVNDAASTFRATSVTKEMAGGSKNEGTPGSSRSSNLLYPTLSSTPATILSTHRPESPSTLSSSSTTIELASLPSSKINRSYGPGVDSKSTAPDAPLDGTTKSRTSCTVHDGKRATRIDYNSRLLKFDLKKRKKARVVFVVVTTLLSVFLLLIKIRRSKKLGIITSLEGGLRDMSEEDDDDFITDRSAAATTPSTKLTTVIPPTIDDDATAVDTASAVHGNGSSNDGQQQKTSTTTTVAKVKPSSIVPPETGENTTVENDIKNEL